MPDRAPTSTYIHGTTQVEQERLSLLNGLLNEACLRELALAPGARVLDMGSGLGQFTRHMGRAAGPEGWVLGIERDPAQLAEALRQADQAGETDLVEWRPGDVFDPPLKTDEWGTFDVAHTRFVLEHVPDPLRVVQRMAQAVRPGGRIVLADDDHDVLRLWPDPPGFRILWEAYTRVYDHMGNDPYVGRRLVALLHAAGATPKRNTVVFFGSCSGHPLFEAFVSNLAGVVEGARDAVLSELAFDPDLFDETLATFRTWHHRPDAAIWYGLCWAEGTRVA